MYFPLVIHSIDFLAFSIGIAGIITGILIARQSWQDRIAGKLAHRNGWFHLHTLIGIRNGLAGSIGHGLLALLALLAFLTTPIPSRYILSVIFACVYVLIQSAIIIPQFFNLIDGNRLRRSDPPSINN